MTLEQWQTNEMLVSWTMKLFATPEWNALMGMLASEHPMRKLNNAPGFTVNDDSKALGMIAGWNLFETALKAAGQPIKQPEPLVATFAEPEPDELPVEPKRKRRK